MRLKWTAWVVVTLLTLACCDETETQTLENLTAMPTARMPSVSFGGDDSLYAFTHEGCEYLFYSQGYKSAMTHKGNCDNPIHKPARAWKPPFKEPNHENEIQEK